METKRKKSIINNNKITPETYGAIPRYNFLVIKRQKGKKSQLLFFFLHRKNARFIIMMAISFIARIILNASHSITGWYYGLSPFPLRWSNGRDTVYCSDSGQGQ